VLDEELVLALPPGLVERAIEGMHKLSAIGLRLPIGFHGAEHDPKSALGLAYPESDFARDLGEKKKRG
jgi:hypothetical protein